MVDAEQQSNVTLCGAVGGEGGSVLGADMVEETSGSVLGSRAGQRSELGQL